MLISFRFTYSKLILSLYILSSVFFRSILGSENILRGVPISKQNLYDPSKNFLCLDGTSQIPSSFINDDYCDCRDGTDEPGTSACPNGVFHCVNKGHFPNNIPSSRVNDGICDCCDGSDEYLGRIDCQNTCLAMGQKAREEAQEQLKLRSEGYQLYQGLVEQGKNILNSYKEKLEVLKVEQTQAKQIQTEKESIKNELEAKEKEALAKYESEKDELKKEMEAEELRQHLEEEKQNAQEAFLDLDKDGNGLLTVSELQSFSQFDNDKDGIVSEEEAKFYLHAKEEMGLEEFVTTGWMIMKPIYLREQEDDVEPPPPDVEETPEEERLDEDPTAEPSNDEEDEEEEEEVPMFPPKLEEDSKKEDEASAYTPEVQALVDEASKARREFNEASDRVRNIENEIRDLEETLSSDFGPNSEFVVLKGHCFDFDDREYIYKLCPFDSSSQNPKAGGSSISLGKWGKWNGPEGNEYLSMRYETGTVCWNGPARSVNVNLSCGTENKILGTSEPNRCEYQMDFTSPALCSSPPEQHHQHTEL